MITYKHIKELVEATSKIEDIGIKSRKRHVRDARYVYARLCYLHVDGFTLADCGKEIDRHYSTIIHALKTFKEGIDKNWFSANNIYYICNSTLKKIQRETVEDKTVYSLEYEPDGIVERIKDEFTERSRVGQLKYNTTLEKNNRDDFLQHLKEELMDAILYISKLQSN